METRSNQTKTSPRIEVGDMVVFDYRGRKFPAVVESVEKDGCPNLTGFENGKVVHMPRCKAKAWHRK